MGTVVYVARGYAEDQWAWIADYNTLFIVGLVGFSAMIYFMLVFTLSKEFRRTVERNLPFNVPIVKR